MILVATDSHTTTHGAFGCLGNRHGATDMATVLITGKLPLVQGCRKSYGYTWEGIPGSHVLPGTYFVYHREIEGGWGSV